MSRREKDTKEHVTHIDTTQHTAKENNKKTNSVMKINSNREALRERFWSSSQAAARIALQTQKGRYMIWQNLYCKYRCWLT